MKKEIRNYKLICFIIFASIILFSCNNEGIGIVTSNSIINQLQNNLKLSNFTNKNISENLEINWSDLKKTEKEGVEIYQIDAVEKNKSVIQSKLLKQSLCYQLIAIKDINTTKSYLIEAFSNSKSELYPSSIENINVFTGTLNVFDLNGNKLDQIVINKGNANSINKNSDVSTLVKTINLFFESRTMTSRAPTCNNGTSYTTVTDIYIDTYNIAYVNNGSTLTLVGIYYMGTKYVGTNISNINIAGDCNSTAGQIQILQRQSSYRDYYINDHITFDGLNPCSQAVMQQLINAPSKSVITEIYNKLGANFTKYDVQIKSEVPTNGSPANTFRTSTFNYTIQLNPNYPDATKLGRAAALLHELVHAYFISLFDDYHNANPKDLNAYTNFPFLYDLYVTKKYPSSTDRADIQHQQMADSYVDAIARNLQEYQTGIAVPDTQVPEQIYSDLAWGGLSEAPVFAVKYPEGTLARDRVINRYNCEMVGHGVDEGTTKEQKPIGKPCN